MSDRSACPTPSAGASGFSPLRFLLYAVPWFAGVILPLIALACAVFILYVVGIGLPFVVLVQILSIAVVPLANGLLLRALARARPALSRRVGHAHGFATGVSLVFSLLFLPHLAAGVDLLPAAGAGLLLLAPLLSLLAALAIRGLLAPLRAPPLPLPSIWPGMLLALAIVAGPELPQAVNQAGARMVGSDAPATRANGVRLLRYLGSQKILLGMCDSRHDRTGSVTDLLAITAMHTSNPAACEALYLIGGVRHVPDPNPYAD